MKLDWLKVLVVFFKQRIAKPLRQVGVFYLWVFITLAVLLFAASQIQQLLFSGDMLSQRALERGQQLVYDIASGDIEGTPRHTKKESEVKLPVVGQGGAVVEETFAGNEGLAPAPLDTITEQTDHGLIPTTGKDGTLPWKYYARPYTPKEQRPVVAIIITNLGLSKPLTEEVLTMPHTLTLSFSPYASDAKNWAKRARGSGFESLVDLPVEPSNFPISDPGPYGLLGTLDPSELSNRLHWILSRYPGYVGTLATLDEKITQNLSAMRSVLTELTARGIVFVYRKTEQNAELASFIKAQNLLGLGADAVLDEDLSPASVTQKLDALAETAKQQGYAIGIARSYPPSMRAITLWMEGLEKKGVDVAPLSAVAAKVFP